jgi:light-regulated signal transduction histidine kinase (bacteriophytochrome)
MSGLTLRSPRIRRTEKEYLPGGRKSIDSKATWRGLYPVDRADRDLLSTISRELRPRLAVVARHCDILQYGKVGELNEIQVEKVEVVNASADKMADELETAAWGLSVLGEVDWDYFDILSQQLRNHLVIIKGYADALQYGDLGKLASPQVEMVKVINASADRMIGILDELLDVNALQQTCSAKGIWPAPNREDVGRMVCRVSNL